MQENKYMNDPPIIALLGDECDDDDEDEDEYNDDNQE